MQNQRVQKIGSHPSSFEEGCYAKSKGVHNFVWQACRKKTISKKFEVKVLAGACEVLRVMGCVFWRIESLLLSNFSNSGGKPIMAPVLYSYSSVFNLALL